MSTGLLITITICGTIVVTSLICGGLMGWLMETAMKYGDRRRRERDENEDDRDA